MRFFVVLLLALAPSLPALAEDSGYLDSLLQAARQRDLAHDKHWLNLGHYKKTWFGAGPLESQADGEDFFLAPNGKTDPEAELEATIRGFFAPHVDEVTPDARQGQARGEKLRQHPQCQFPARFLWLREALSIDPARLPIQTCPRFEKFKAATSARSATVIFSSYYLNNPSSAFGHSFIRLNKDDGSRDGERHELLDYGINYAAATDSGNPFVYSFKGLLGMFPGTFTSMPFYYKVREYNDFEARDLWEYDLNLTPRQIEMLVAHFWELGSTYFNYWYLTQNCSYHVLTALEAANPDLHLTERQNKVVIPVDTIQVLTSEPGLVRAVHYRPSIRAIFDHRASRVPRERLGDLAVLTATHDPARLSADLRPGERAAILDAGMDYLDLKYSGDLLDHESQAAAWKQKLLVARAQIPIQSEELRIEPDPRDMPHAGHTTRRAVLEGGYSDTLGNFGRLEWRGSLHDLLDPEGGYPESAQIEMGEAAIRYNAGLNGAGSGLGLDELNLVKVVSLSPVQRFRRSLSWRVNVGTSRFYDESCDFCYGMNLGGGAGYAIKPWDGSPFTAFLMAEAQLAASPSFLGTHFRPGFGPGGGVRIHLTDRWIGLLEARYHRLIGVEHPDDLEASAALRWVPLSWLGIHLRGASFPHSNEVSLGLLVYH